MGDRLNAFKDRVDQFKKNRAERKERERLDAEETKIERLAREEQERRAKGGKKRVLKDVLGGAAIFGGINFADGADRSEALDKAKRGAAFGAGLGAAKSIGRGIKNKLLGRMSGMGHKTDAELAEIRAQKLRSVADRMQANKGN